MHKSSLNYQYQLVQIPVLRTDDPLAVYTHQQFLTFQYWRFFKLAPKLQIQNSAKTGPEPATTRPQINFTNHSTTHATCARSVGCSIYPSHVHSQLSNPLLGGWHCRFGKTADAIVFGLKNCLRYDRSQPCNSWIFSRKPQKTPFSGHFWYSFRPPFTSEISTFFEKPLV